MSTFASSSCPGFIHPFVLARSRQSGTTFPSLYCPARPLSALLKLSPSNASPEKHLSPGRPLRSLCALALALLLQPAVAANAKNLLTENTIFRRYLVTDSAAILRYTLPLPSERLRDPSPAPIRLVQEQLERLGVHLRARGVAGIIAGRRDVEDVQRILSQRQLDILLDVPASGRQAAAEKLTKLEVAVADIGYELGTSAPVVGQTLFPRDVVRVEQTLRDALTPRNTLKSIANYDSTHLEALRTAALQSVSDIEEIAVEGTGLSFRIPRRYNSLPRLLGRARVQFEVEKGSGEWTDENKQPIGKRVKMTAIVDGFSAPLTSGNFVDLVKRGYYDGTRVLSMQREFYAQLGERENDNVAGFVDPGTGKRREIPLEILATGEPTPTYGATFDDLGIGDLQPSLPVSAFGAMAMVHSVEDANDASSQFYFFVIDPTSPQARSFGGSALTGSLATFGYVVDGKGFLSQLRSGDRVLSASVVSGGNNFRASGDG